MSSISEDVNWSPCDNLKMIKNHLVHANKSFFMKEKWQNNMIESKKKCCHPHNPYKSHWCHNKRHPVNINSRHNRKTTKKKSVYNHNHKRSHHQYHFSLRYNCTTPNGKGLSISESCPRHESTKDFISTTWIWIVIVT